MKGILEKKDGDWFIRWSDLHSFARGREWIYTPLHPDEVIDETNLKHGDVVGFDLTDFDLNFGYKYVRLNNLE